MERPTIKDKAVLAYVEEIEGKLKVFTESPFVKTYITIKNQIDSFNEQLTIDESTTVQRVIGQDKDGNAITDTYIKGKIDLFGDKDSKEFDRSWKYMLESVDMNKKLDELRKLMTPEQIKQVQKAETRSKNRLGFAEKISLMENGNS